MVEHRVGYRVEGLSFFFRSEFWPEISPIIFLCKSVLKINVLTFTIVGRIRDAKICKLIFCDSFFLVQLELSKEDKPSPQVVPS